MEGYDLRWTEWQSRPSREFTNLHEGKYIFHVKARNIYDTKSDVVSLKFEVWPPLHRSVIAYVIYFIMGIVFIIMIFYALKKRFEYSRSKAQTQQRLLFAKKEESMQREKLEAEKELIRMRNDKLREEVTLKNKELANATMQALHKNEVLINLKNELNKILNASSGANEKYKLNHLIRRINKDIDNESQWEIFETHFESVHEAFLNRIKSSYPSLTPRELKLCAYLRMNISSKEISVLMNISTRGVEISRYRLRKKLSLNREENLTGFILNF